ncbi:MAG: methyltransferase domain-containing protein [Thiotrichales bacterium]|nr:methyltransferase domain-containing protein [Thiotrichales bacterium]
MFDDKLPILDLRQEDVYREGHLIGASHFPWPSLLERLNELSARPAKLQIVGEAAILNDAADFLVDKGYEVVQLLTSEKLTDFLSQTPEICQVGSDSRILWQPCTLLKQTVENNFSPGRALDIGCGGGRDAVYLSQQGWQVTAIDKQEAVLSRARQLADNHHQTIDFRSCDLSELSCLPDETFDLIVMVRYLNRDLYSWIRQHLAPGGLLVVQTFTEGVEAFGSPKNPNFILRAGELAKTFSDFEIIVDKIEPLKDGRPVASFVAKNKEEQEIC